MGGFLGTAIRTRGVALDALLAVTLAVGGVVELFVIADDARPVDAIAIVVMTVPLAWRQRLALVSLAAVTGGLLIDVLAGGAIVGTTAVPLAAIAIALYSAGRYESGRALAAAGLLTAALVALRLGLDTGLRPVDALLTAIAVPAPLLAGRWIRGQVHLQAELERLTVLLERQRERDVRHAAEAERLRIAGDLQVAVADGLEVVVSRARELGAGLPTSDPARARLLFAEAAATARAALDDVRRVLGLLRHTDESRPGRGADDAVTDAPRGARAPTPWWLDAAFVALLLAGGCIELATSVSGGSRVVAALTAIPIVLPLLARRRLPVGVAFATLGAIAVQSALVDFDRFPAVNTIAVVLAMYAVGACVGSRRSLIAAGVFAVADGVHAAVFYPDAIPQAVLFGVLVPWTIGRLVRRQRRLTAELREAVLEVERGRARDAAAAATAERARMARELHDAVAHSLSVIAIQAAGGDQLVQRGDDRAAGCAELVERVGTEALGELRRLVAPDSTGAPTLARLGALVDSARDGGLEVELRVEGDRRSIPSGIDLAAYRIVQEALANASKHALDGRASVVVRYEPAAVEVEVANDGRPVQGGRSRAAGHGLGLVGMRERAALYGGSFEGGPRAAGGFLVRAQLPLGSR